MAQFFIYFLVGIALDWFTSLSEDVSNNYDKLKLCFLQRFTKQSHPAQALAELFLLKQGPGQTVIDFVTQVKKTS